MKAEMDFSVMLSIVLLSVAIFMVILSLVYHDHPEEHTEELNWTCINFTITSWLPSESYIGCMIGQETNQTRHNYCIGLYPPIPNGTCNLEAHTRRVNP